MTAKVSYDDVEVGTELPAQTFQVQRANLVQYCGASGDFNIIHWNERVAKAVGLPDVIAHGMFTMAEAGRVVTDWVGDPGAVVDADGKGCVIIKNPAMQQALVLDMVDASKPKRTTHALIAGLSCAMVR